MGLADRRVLQSRPLDGARVLVVEDDFFIAAELAAILSDAGAEVVGPSQTVASALQAADDNALSAAILDIRLGRDTVAPVARRLAARHVPFLFYTGQAKIDPLFTEWPGCIVVSKPALPEPLISAVALLVDRRVTSSQTG